MEAVKVFEQKPEEQRILSIVHDSEIVVATRNEEYENNEFESLVDMLECKRSEKDYDWMSDNFLPELPSILLTDASDWANQYFQTRTFVEVALEGDRPEDKQKCNAVKKLINKTLNNRDIFHFQKYIRGRLINALRGQVYAICWWEKKRRNDIIGQEMVEEQLETDIHGNPMVNPMLQEPMVKKELKPKIDDSLIYDRFNYDVLDPRNVYTDHRYAYSAQYKDWITIRAEESYGDLVRHKDDFGYFNLDKVKELFNLSSNEETSSAAESYNKVEKKETINRTPISYFDVYERYGKFWCIVEDEDDKGRPIKIKSGYDDYGDISDKAELVECIIAWASKGGNHVLIRFQPTPYYDSNGNTYKPIVRGWCYVHPTKDIGLSDGKYGRELQSAINDTFNMSNDKVKLSTLPTLKGRRNSLLDNDTVYFEPEHIIQLENVDDLQEFKITPDVQAAIGQIGMLRSYMQQITAKYPTTMGELPEQSNITATAVSQTGDRASSRNNYKSLTMEFTYLIEFYWMIIQMTAQFMEEETAKKVFGELIEAFDPNGDYTYSPVTSAIESDQNKFRKLQIIDQFIGRVGSIPNPKTAQLLNYLLTKAFELFGDEFPEYKNYLLDPNFKDTGGETNNTKDLKDQPTTNQMGQPMTGGEQEARNQQMPTGGMIG
jgi:hypothetical protein